MKPDLMDILCCPLDQADLKLTSRKTEGGEVVDGVLTCNAIPPNGFNETRYCNRTVDAENDRYLHSYDPRVQNAAAAAFQRQIDEDAPLIVIYERAFLAVYDNRLRGYHPTPYSWWGDPLQIDI